MNNFRYNNEGKHGGQPPRGQSQPFQPPADLRQVSCTGMSSNNMEIFWDCVFVFVQKIHDSLYFKGIIYFIFIDYVT